MSMDITRCCTLRGAMMRKHLKLVRWGIGIVGGLLVGFWIALLVGSRAPILRQALLSALNDKLDAEVELEDFGVKTFPLLRIHGDNLKLRLKNQQNPAPFIQVRHFEVTGGVIGMFRRPRRFTSVELDGLRITIPPRTGDDNDVGGKAATAVGGPVIIDRVEAKDAELIIVAKNPRKEPKVWAIHNLVLQSVGFNRSMPFVATLRNPIPKGEIAVTGSFGPWVKQDPGLTPMSGRYTFDQADLGTIDGIGGILKSVGDFSGRLDTIDVRGTTTTPDFRLDVGSAAMPLDTTFHALVDGTNGDTYLKSVQAKLGETPIETSGAIVSHPDVKGRTVQLDMAINDGRLRDVLTLAVKAPKPVMEGRIALQATMLLPPGKTPVPDRLKLEGRFALEDTVFTDAFVSDQVAMLSHRARGRKTDQPMEKVRSDMRGRFTLGGGVLRLDPLVFDVPGAEADLAGSYGLRSEQLGFAGTLTMTAPVSKAMGGGIKGFLLNPFDPLFRKDGKGAVVPITIEGPRVKPKFGVDWGKVFK